MGKYKDFDFGKAKSLMDFVVAAGQHGPMYNTMAAMAGEELKDMLDEAGLMQKQIKDVTPPAGPANAAIAPVRELQPAPAEPVVMKTNLTDEDKRDVVAEREDEAERASAMRPESQPPIYPKDSGVKVEQGHSTDGRRSI